MDAQRRARLAAGEGPKSPADAATQED